MSKLVIFDLDGVLIDSRELHYDALNDALRKIGEEFVITREEHLSKYDGLNTTRKLKMLTEQKGLPISAYDQVWQDKQESTFKLVRGFCKEYLLQTIFRQVKARGYKIAVASNAIRETVKLSLLSIGVMDEVDYFVSNEDVTRAKPYPEMYWKCMTALNVLPKNTIIVEDSHIGRQAALDSGAHLLAVENAKEVNSEHMMQRIYDLMNTIEGTSKKSLPWRDKKLNVLIQYSRITMK
jgi:beta-phosphoglucomutase-like phosphatase (HAD superfamily)